jgi:hypothetical protein
MMMLIRFGGGGGTGTAGGGGGGPIIDTHTNSSQFVLLKKLKNFNVVYKFPRL